MSDQPATRYSRRAVLKGVAAAGGLAAVPAWGVLDASSVALAAEKTPPLEGPLVAYIRDATKGEIVFMMGTAEVVRRDSGLVSRLLGAARSV